MRRDGNALSFRVERWDRLDRNSIPDEPIGGVTEQHLGRSCLLLQARRRIHGFARGERIARRRIGRYHLTTIDSHSHFDRHTMGGADFAVEGSHGREEIGGGTNRT